jgi:hypothetical protein
MTSVKSNVIIGLCKWLTGEFSTQKCNITLLSFVKFDFDSFLVQSRISNKFWWKKCFNAESIKYWNYMKSPLKNNGERGRSKYYKL